MIIPTLERRNETNSGLKIFEGVLSTIYFNFTRQIKGAKCRGVPP